MDTGDGLDDFERLQRRRGEKGATVHQSPILGVIALNTNVTSFILIALWTEGLALTMYRLYPPKSIKNWPL